MVDYKKLYFKLLNYSIDTQLNLEKLIKEIGEEVTATAERAEMDENFEPFDKIEVYKFD